MVKKLKGFGVVLCLTSDPYPPKMIPIQSQAGWHTGLETQMRERERGEPLITPIKSSSELSTAVTKAACVQAMHEPHPINTPITAPVNCEK